MIKNTLLLITFLLFSSACFSQKSKNGKFEVGDKTFLLNDEPFVIKAAEIHYPRIPKEYWEHRIEMCKALGMNTICLYVFWNFHEQEEGKFDFTGQKDIAEFCRLAQKHNLYIIVRPGPYVCAEWDMGGLPWWLLKKKDIRLRENDPYYLERTAIFIGEVGKQLADMQITRGGNIIMFQVENEYGSYGTDKSHIKNIRDILLSSGFTDVPLFQCDWNSNFENNALDGLLWTINFGTGANIDEQFKRLKEMRPDTPLMCSEFWSGWFDHWGAKHETRSAEELVKGMKEMLDNNISFSLYMTHGGTSFGQWAGANYPNFSPTCTSYDYDAPINESGKVTPKYFEVRKLLKKYLPKEQSLPEIPDSIPTINIPSFTLTETAPFFDNLPKVQYSENVEPMEFFNQGWGTIMYRTKLKKSDKSRTLILTEAHDWTQIFIDGNLIATLSRLKGEKSALIPPVKEGAVLDIVVEAMGRMNFSRGIYDWKGITEKVEINDGQNTTQLKGWEVYSFPTDYGFVKGLKFKKSSVSVSQPSYYRGTFNIDKTGDTFLNMMNWHKGLVWVNGYCVGRFWEVGPQQSLYVPGCWLKEGENEVIVLDLVHTNNSSIQGLRQPILDVLRGNSVYVNRKEGENLDLHNETPFYTGTFKPGNGWQHINLNGSKEARYFCLETLDSYNDDYSAAIAELEILGKDGKPLSRQHWKVFYADSEETELANNIASNVLDLQESTFWHTNYSTSKVKHPHHIVIDLGGDFTITGFSYLPRAEAGATGMIKTYNIYLKEEPFKK